ncbi:MAG: AAA family ATPase [Atopobiaceae bacterium]|nr:AAA family ATPase [Atopobiaceae bacterium]
MPKNVPHALEFLSTQPRVRDLLATAVTEGKLSHAYLFLGAPGSGKTETARALAECVVCPHGGDGSCDECLRVKHGTHPDVRFYRPASATGYLVGQVRGIIADVALAPVRSSHKVYVLEEVGTLRGAAANALLKTIEEPPEGVMFILIGRTAAAVMPTIVSRCQQVPFRVVSSAAAERSVERASGLAGSEARIALAVAGTPDRAAEFLASPERRQVRRLMVRAVSQLDRADSWDVLCAARDLVSAVKAPLAGLKTAQEEALGESADFLATSALRKVEDANKRELTARERSGMMEALSAAESLLRDVLLQCEGVDEPIVNEDVADAVDRIASYTSSKGVLDALDAVRVAADNIAHNVTPQLALEAMLLSVKEALTCPPSSR